MTLTRVILVLTKPVSGRERNRRTFSPNFSEQPNGDLERGQIEKFPPNNKQRVKKRKKNVKHFPPIFQNNLMDT